MLNIIQTSQVNHYITVQLRELHGGFAVETVSQERVALRFDYADLHNAEIKYSAIKAALELNLDKQHPATLNVSNH